jgi:cytochrome P450
MTTTGAGESMGMDFDLLSPDLRDDPYPHYDRLRAEAPVHRSHLGPWLLARHSDGEGVLRGFRRFANIDPVSAEKQKFPCVSLLAILAEKMVFSAWSIPRHLDTDDCIQVDAARART